MFALRLVLTALYIWLDLQVTAVEAALRVLDETDRDSERDIDGTPAEGAAYSRQPDIPVDIPQHLRRREEAPHG